MPNLKAVDKPSHTPGPWHLHDMEEGIICTPGGLGIVDCKASMLCNEERKANAAYIVRAVSMHEELLEQLKAVRNWIAFECDGVPGTHGIPEAIDKAIAKAEGK